MCDFDAFARVRLVVFHFTERERDILERKGVGKGVGVTLPKFYRSLRTASLQTHIFDRLVREDSFESYFLADSD